MTQPTNPEVRELEDAIRKLAAAPPERALADLTAVANRAIIELHKIAREQANSRRGQPDWGRWAGLANAARSTVLQMAAVRDSLRKLGGGAATPASGHASADTEGADSAPP